MYIDHDPQIARNPKETHKNSFMIPIFQLKELNLLNEIKKETTYCS